MSHAVRLSVSRYANDEASSGSGYVEGGGYVQDEILIGDVSGDLVATDVDTVLTGRIIPPGGYNEHDILVADPTGNLVASEFRDELLDRITSADGSIVPSLTLTGINIVTRVDVELYDAVTVRWYHAGSTQPCDVLQSMTFIRFSQGDIDLGGLISTESNTDVNCDVANDLALTSVDGGLAPLAVVPAAVRPAVTRTQLTGIHARVQLGATFPTLLTVNSTGILELYPGVGQGFSTGAGQVQLYGGAVWWPI